MLAWMRIVVQDVRFGLRQFRRAPGYAVFAVLVLTLGIGTVTAMFAISYGVLLKPLPFHADRQLFQAVIRNSKGSEDYAVTYQEVQQWQDATKGLGDIAFSSGGLNIADGPAGAVLVSEISVSPSLFSLLGAAPMIGRSFVPTEQWAEHRDVVVLSHALWLRNFGGDRKVLGKTMHIGGVLYTIVGVMPPAFEFPTWDERPEVWVPLVRSDAVRGNATYGGTFVPLVRLRPGVRPEAVNAAIARVHTQFADKDDTGHLQLVRLHDLVVRDVRPALFALEIAVGVVWLIACSNVAGLLLARMAARHTEIAVRAALGARRWRIAAQFLTESLLLCAASAAGGLALAVLILRMFRHLLGTMLPMSGNIELNWVVWLGLVVLTLLTCLAFGAVPALLAAWTGTKAGLGNSGHKHTGDRTQNRARTILLVGEVALSIALLIGAGLMMRTMYALRHVPLGFRTDHLVMTSLTVSNSEYQNRNVGTAAWQPLLDTVRHMPGVREAALSTVLPLKHPVELLTIVYKTDWTEADVSATVRAASPGLMDVLGVQVKSGRFFNDGDTATSSPVAVVNRTFADRYLGGADAIGKQFRFGREKSSATTVGVIGDVRQDDITAPSQPEFYVCMTQLAPGSPLYRALLGRYMQLAVRTDLPPQAMITELRRGIAESNRHLAIGEFATMEEAVEDSIGSQKLAAQVIGVFGGLALLMTAVGLYGLLSYSVEQRTREIGIRMALGADRGAVVGMVIRQTLLLVGSGAAIGVGMALWSSRLLHAFLYDVSASDPWTMALAPVALVICGLMAAAVPARRAASVNPVEALRAE
jgi:predicted permease